MTDPSAHPNLPSISGGATVRQSAFEELLGRLQKQCTMDANALMSALFAIRAPHDLVGVVPWCRYIDVLVHSFPEFRKKPAFDDQEARLRVVHQIGQLHVPSRDHSDLGRWRVQRREKPTYAMEPSSPAYLLLASEPWRSLPVDPSVLAVHGWFTWQVLHHQARNESLQRYRKYLLGRNWPRESISPSSSRLASVARSFRQLFRAAEFSPVFPDSDTYRRAASQLSLLAELIKPFTADRSAYMLGVLRRIAYVDAALSTYELPFHGSDEPRVSASDQWALNLRQAFPVRTATVREAWNLPNPHQGMSDPRQLGISFAFKATATPDHAVRNDDPPVPPPERREWRPYLPELRRFLETVWLHTEPASRARHAGARRCRGSIVWDPVVEQYDSATFISQAVDEGDVQDGIAADLYEPTEPPTEPLGESVRVRVRGAKGTGAHSSPFRHRVVWSDDPEVEEPVEPTVTLFLAQHDVQSGWYAARSAAHHIERENAWLQWPEWRLSDTAIRAVLAWVVRSGDPSFEVAWARLTVGLSLVSGRSLTAACSVRVVNRAREARYDGMWIDPARHLLSVPAGTPKLQSVAPETVKAYCAPHAETLRLPLPQAWTPLLDRLATREPPPLDTLRNAVEHALIAFPTDAAITQKGVSCALKLALLDRSRGDLGLVKAITDAGGTNLNNIIHYASYDRRVAEQHWRSIVRGWAGPLHAAPDEPQPVDPLVICDTGRGSSAVVDGGDAVGARVGTPYSIDPAKIAPGIAALKARFREAVAAERWADVNNLLTLYVAVWLGLATAGRAVREPAPGIILQDGWALVRDKHRPDESTDRYVPLGDSIRAQLDALRDFTAVLGLANESFALPHAGTDHLLNLRLVQSDGSVVPFHPVDFAQDDLLRDLPGNWARKVVRACTAGLPGRFLDAGLGHWVRGRHPWTLTSTFPAAWFRSQWLTVQARLEQQLGMEVLNVPDLPRFKARSLPPAPRRQARPDAQGPLTGEAAAKLDEKVATVLADCHGELWYDRVFKQRPPDRSAALELAKWAIAHADGALGPDLATTAKQVCTYIRTKAGIPLFATRPRGRFQRNWLVKRHEFEALAYVEQVLLPAIMQDLQQLPSLEIERTRLARRAMDAAHQSWIWCKLRAGRLIVALALRAGLVSTMHLEAFLREMAGDRPLLAIGDTRLGQLEVVSGRATDTMCRTVLLEPYLAALIACERDAVRPWLLRVVQDPKVERRAEHWNAALRAYLRGLELPADITVSVFLAAIRQRIQLDAAPLLAAYASGEILTHDLSLHELTRLAGCTVPDALVVPGVGAAFGGPENVHAKVWQRHHRVAAELTRRERVRAMKLAIEDPPPADVAASEANLPDRLTPLKSRAPRTWLQRIDQVREQMHDRSLGCLLCAFAADLVATYLYRSGHRDQENQAAEADRRDTASLFGPKRQPRVALSPRFGTWARSHLVIVWAGLTGFSAVLDDHPCVDEDVVQALAEATEAYFPARRQRAAWSRFRYFLMDPHADHAGFEVGAIDTGRLRPVSAKLLSRAELDRAAAYLGSVRSGLGAARTRSVACRHFELIRATGARRAEVAHLRWADVDGNCVRVRPYAGHTLKTPASERVIPAGLLDRGVWRHLREGKTPGATQLIADGPLDGANFFDAEAKAIKYGGDDVDLGPHHLRHTKANALLLKVLGNCVDIGLLRQDFPWVEGVLPPDRELKALLGQGGQCGQGLQAISMLLGHLHPTTTLKHYVHTLCLALYAHALGQPAISLHRAFGHRIKGRAALYRHVQRASSAETATRYALGRVEADAEAWHRALGHRAPLVVPAAPRAHPVVACAQVSGDEGGGSLATAHVESSGSAAARGWTVAELEGWQRYFATGTGPPPKDADSLRSALHALAAIPTGKRGSHTPRHPLPEVGRDGIRLPAMIRSGSEAAHAQQLLDWLAALRQARPADFDWLLDKWRYASEVQEGLMRLDGGETERAESLSQAWGVVPEIRAGHIAMKRKGSGATVGMRLRIQFVRATEPPARMPRRGKQAIGGAGSDTRRPRYADVRRQSCAGFSRGWRYGMRQQAPISTIGPGGAMLLTTATAR